MPRPLIAITDSPFPSLDPAKKALARLDPEYRMAKSPSADDILAVARDADAVLVTYAKLPGELLRQLESGSSVAMTADVPKRARVAGRGIVTLAKLSGRPIVPTAAVPSISRPQPRLNSVSPESRIGPSGKK